MISIGQIRDSWQSFFYAPESAYSLGIFRIVWGIILIINALLMIGSATRYLGPNGIYPAAVYRRTFGLSRLCVLNLLPQSDWCVYLVISVQMFAAAALAMGWHTRVSALLAFVTLVSLHHRNPSVFHSGDAVLRLITFLFIFSNAGDAYGLDQMVSTNSVEPSPPWCLRLMQLQICIIYLRSCQWKMRGNSWRNGTAVYYPTQVDDYRRRQLPQLLTCWPIVATMTYFTLGLEGSFGFLVWVKELRYPVLLAGLVLHVLLEIFLNLQLFGWIMMSSYLLFVPSQDMHWFIDWLRSV
jgi:hypothetical protein